MVISGKRLAQFGAVCGAVALAGCASGPSPSGERRAALDVLAFEFERTVFPRRARVSGAVAQAQQRVLVSTASSGRLRQEAHGPIPTEVRVEITELVSKGGFVSMRGKLALRDLSFGKIMAELPDFRGSGTIPRVGRGASVDGLVFRAVEDEVLAWVRTLSCDTALRVCGIAPPQPVAIEAPEIEAPEMEGADLDLDDMVGRRPGGLRKINTGGIDPDKIVAAAAAPAVAHP